MSCLLLGLGLLWILVFGLFWVLFWALNYSGFRFGICLFWSFGFVLDFDFSSRFYCFISLWALDCSGFCFVLGLVLGFVSFWALDWFLVFFGYCSVP